MDHKVFVGHREGGGIELKTMSDLKLVGQTGVGPPERSPGDEADKKTTQEDRRSRIQ